MSFSDGKNRLVVAAAVILVLTAARELHPNISTAVFAGNGLQRQPPLVVLRAGEARRVELEIFAEDPNWAYKVRKTRATVA